MTNSKAYKPYTLRIGGKEVEQSAFTILGFSKSFGGARVDQATVEVELGNSQTFIQEASAKPDQIEQTLEIFDGAKRLFWGVIEDSVMSFGDSSDARTLVASIQPHHFGFPATAVQYLDIRPSITRGQVGTQRAIVSATEPIVFNGFVSHEMENSERTIGHFVGNKAHLEKFPLKDRNGKNTKGEAYLPIPLESVQTAAGRERYGDVWRAFDTRTRWGLRDAVEYMCVLCNDEAFIANPSNADLEGIDDFILPRTELKLGGYLPDYLDQLLEPYGYRWAVEHDTTGKPRIAFAQYGVGEVVSAKYAKVGAAADFDTTNVANIDASYSISQTINEVHVIGGSVELEGTFELHRVEYDKWVLNEAGDYQTSTFDQYRPSYESSFADGTPSQVAFPDLTHLIPSSALGDFGDTRYVQRIYRRRRFYPTITQIGVPSTGGDTAATNIVPIGPNRGYDIEIIDYRQEDAAETAKKWINVDELEDTMWHAPRVLEDECGIVFDRGRDESRGTADDDASVHEAENSFLVALDDQARIRITATIVTDFAVQVRVLRDTNAASVANRKHVYVWRNPERWPCRRVISSGRYKSKYSSELNFTKTPTADEIVADMKRAARQILSRTDAAVLAGTIQFNSLDNNVPLGGIVKSIAGREVSLATRTKDDTQIWPQVVAVHYDAQAATITAQLSAAPAGGFDAFA